MTPREKTLSITEFVILLATMISIVAMATDVMLPALDVIGHDLNVADPNDAQFIVSSLFLGFAVGQILVGPLSDSYGRKPIIYLGYLIFAVGCLLSLFATSWAMMLVGRVLQGLGAASPRVVTLALVRDCYEGRSMARIMSIVMAVFILMPTIAPALGLGVIYLSGWRATFALLLGLAAVSSIWFALRQPETLAVSERRQFSVKNIVAGIVEVCSYRVVIGYTVASGCVFGAFLGYLSSAQQVFEITFNTGSLFAFYFGVAALAIGAASLTNSHLVMRLGMRYLTWWALVSTTVFSAIFLLFVMSITGPPPLWVFMAWLLVVFFCMGILFGNLNAIAMEPVGHIAGLGAAIIGSLSTFISLPLAWFIGSSFNGSVVPMVLGFGVLGLTSLVVVMWTERGSNDQDALA